MQTLSPAPLLNMANEHFRDGQWESALTMYSIWETIRAAGIDRIPFPQLKPLKIRGTLREWATAAGYRLQSLHNFPRPTRPARYDTLPPIWQEEIRRVQDGYENGLPIVEAEACSVFVCKVGSATVQSYPISRTDDIHIERCHLLPQLHSNPDHGATNRFHPFVDLESHEVRCNFEGLGELQFDENCLFVGGNANIYHFLYDLIGKIVSLECLNVSNNIKYLFLNLSDWQRDVLEHLGICSERIIDVRVEPGNGLILNFERVCFAHGAPTQAVHTYLNLALRAHCRSQSDLADRKIYLSRRGPLEQSRVANEAEVRDYLADRGFELVIPEELSVAQKLEIIGSAEAIVCAPLSGQANHVFASEEASFVNLMPWAAGQPNELPTWASVWIRHGLPLMDRSRYVFSEVNNLVQESSIDHSNFYDLGKLGRVLDEVEGR